MSDQVFTPAISERSPSGTHFAELFLAPGPQELNVTGDNTHAVLFGRDWMLEIDDQSRAARLYAENGDGWTEIIVPGHPVIGQVMPGGARRFSLAFDQAATPVVAYEDAAGIIRVTRWDAILEAYVQNVTFAGRDPCLMMDAAANVRIQDSDVLLFYLSADRQRVMCRVQRDNYGIPLEMWDAGQTVILDRAQALVARYQLLLSDATGRALSDALVSGIYPYTPHLERVNVAAAGPSHGSYVNITIHAGGNDGHVTVAAAGPSGGAYAEPVEHVADTDEVSVTAAGPTAGAYITPVEHVSDAGEIDAVAVGPTAGSYDLEVAYLPAPETNDLDVTATGPSGGTYEEA